jgi:hypothetical protein
MYKTVSNIGFVVALLGIVVAIYGFSFLLDQQDLEENAIHTKGTVVDINVKAIYRSPFVKFTTLEGEEIIFLSDLEVNHMMFDYVIGQEVDVIYHKNDPHNAKIDAFWEKYFGQIFLGCFGIFLILLGFLIRWIYRRKQRRYDARGY